MGSSSFWYILIDRIDEINIFNLLRGGRLENPELPPGEKFTTELDPSLIEEYLSKLYEFFTLGLLSSSSQNIEKEFQEFQYTFYKQLFPPSLQEFFHYEEGSFLFFQVDPALASIPFELLFTGEYYLWQKFYIGKSLKGVSSSPEVSPGKSSLKMLILIDPTESLLWAKKEGESLYRFLTKNFPPSLLEVEILGGKIITKLELLQKMQSIDILHYAGHYYFASSIEEQGFLLPQNKILQIKEIKRSGASPLLIFSNACRSSIPQERLEYLSQFYPSFLRAFPQGKTNYVGTIWEIPDSPKVLEYTQSFYQNLLEGLSIGEALYKMRTQIYKEKEEYPLLWASYTLSGHPASRILSTEFSFLDSSSFIPNYARLKKEYPYPLIHSFFQAIQKEQEGKDPKEILPDLFQAIKEIFLFLSLIIFQENKQLKLPIEGEWSLELSKVIPLIYKILQKWQVLQIKPQIPLLGDFFLTHKEEILKLLSWVENPPQSYSPRSLASAIEYYLENFLLHLEPLNHFSLYYITQPGTLQLKLHGLKEYHHLESLLPPVFIYNREKIEKELRELFQLLMHHVILYHPLKRSFIDLHPYFSLVFSSSGDYTFSFRSS